MSSACGLELEDQRDRKLKKEERWVIKSGLSLGDFAKVCPTEIKWGFVVVCSAWRVRRGIEGPWAFFKMKRARISFAFFIIIIF